MRTSRISAASWGRSSALRVLRSRGLWIRSSNVTDLLLVVDSVGSPAGTRSHRQPQGAVVVLRAVHPWPHPAVYAPDGGRLTAAAYRPGIRRTARAYRPECISLDLRLRRDLVAAGR